MQKVGDVCGTCREFWEKRGKEPKVLQRAGATKNHNAIVPLCPFCDGDALKIFNNKS